MKALWNHLIEDETGLILSAELVIILTVAVLGIVVGLNHVATAVNQELTDVGRAIGALNQSYSFTGFQCCWHSGRPTSYVAGSAFYDWQDIGDCLCSGPLGGYAEIGNGTINSGSVGVSVPMTGSPMTGSPHCAVTTDIPVETPCVNCPPAAAPATGHGNGHGQGHSHGVGPAHGNRLETAPLPANVPPLSPSPLNQ